MAETTPKASKKSTSTGTNTKDAKAADDKQAVKPAASKVKDSGPRKKKLQRTVLHGHAHVLATYNNTIVSVTDQSGNVLGWSSSGSLGFKGAKKSTPYAAGQIVHTLMDRLESVGLREVDVFVKGIGSGREAAIRAFQTRGVNVLTIKDITPIPHNGVRAKKVRRV